MTFFCHVIEFIRQDIFNVIELEVPCASFTLSTVSGPRTLGFFLSFASSVNFLLQEHLFW